MSGDSGGAAPVSGASGDNAKAGQDPADRALHLCREGRFDEVQNLVDADSQLWHKTDAEGHTLLHWGALSGNVPFISHGLAAGAQPDVAGANGQTPLMWAVIRGQVPTVRLLLDSQANILARDSLGASTLILAIQHQQYLLLLLLLSRAAEKILRLVDVNGCGPVHWAGYKGDLTSLKLLDYFGADFTVTDNSQMTPLHRAVSAHSFPVCEFLLDKAVDPSLVDSQGRTCLDLAREDGDAPGRITLLRLLHVKGEEEVPLRQGVRLDTDLECGRGAQLQRKQKKDPASDLRLKFLHNAASTFWLVCVSLAVFEYLTDIRETSWQQAPRIALAFELGVPASLALFLLVTQSDPGRMSARIRGSSGVEDLTRALEALDPHNPGELPDFSRLCTTTWVIKGPRTKFCPRTNACVMEFDHFCGWLNVAIGKGNHRSFIFLAIIETCTQFCHLYLCWRAATVLVDSKLEFAAWAFGVATMYPLLLVIGFLHGLTGPAVLCLTTNQLRLICVNLTTNETINAYRYKHFWEEIDEEGCQRKVFKNPFHKGSMLANCLDFWWTCRREEINPRGPVTLMKLRGNSSFLRGRGCRNNYHPE